MAMNMHHCRYENTLNALRECYEADDSQEDLSEEEQKARLQLIRECANFAADYEHEVED